jgi:hypothetical protein
MEMLLSNATTLFCNRSNAQPIDNRLLPLATNLTETEILREEWSGLRLIFGSGQIEVAQKIAHPGNAVSKMKLGIYNFFKNTNDPDIMTLVKYLTHCELAFGTDSICSMRRARHP